jgi:hypothetical protein
VCRLTEGRAETVTLHTGEDAPVQQVWLDDEGALYVESPKGLALVHSQDMAVAADLLDSGAWQASECQASQLQEQFGFVLSPQARMREKK